MNSYLQLFLSCLLVTNVCLNSGFAVPLLYSYKQSFKFTLLVSLMFALVLTATGAVYHVIYNYLLVRFEIEFLRMMILVLIAGVFSFIVYFLLKKINKEVFYVYEKSYTFMFMIVSVIAIVLNQDMIESTLIYTLSMLFYAIGFLVVNLIVYGVFYKVNGTYAPKSLKGLPLLLIILAVLSMACMVIGSIV